MGDIKYENIMIVGCGNGSWAALVAQFYCAKLHLVDYDIIEERNLDRLPFANNEVGQEKVFALERLIRRCKVYVYTRPFSEDLIEGLADLVVIDATDNLESQKRIYKACQDKGIYYLRIGAYKHRYTITSVVEDIWDTTNDDSGRCTEEQIQYVSTVVAQMGTLAKILDSRNNLGHRFLITEDTFQRAREVIHAL